MTAEDLETAYERFLELADKKKEVYDEDLMAIVGDEIRQAPEKYTLEYLHSISGTGTIPSAPVKLAIDGEQVQTTACGDGPVDAAYRAIEKAVGRSVKVDEYNIRAVTSGRQAMGEVTVAVSENGEITKGWGISTDVIEASAKAYIDALNRMALRVSRMQEQVV